jgi:hypothetical protein
MRLLDYSAKAHPGVDLMPEKAIVFLFQAWSQAPQPCRLSLLNHFKVCESNPNHLIEMCGPLSEGLVLPVD